MEVVDTFAPSQETIFALPWPTGSSTLAFPVIDSAFLFNKGWVQVNASTSEVENILNTEYHHAYCHPSGDAQIGEKCRYLYFIYSSLQDATPILCPDIFNSMSISSNLVLYT
jgi:hypothetical protein